MGEVYRARDTRLGRDVALKVLLESVARDAHRVARFRREAQVLASLNHPNIAAIYGFEDSSSVHALVMELVEGPTLAERIKGGAIPLEEVLPIAKQICEALEYAHERGIIHRDLKPANIKLAKNDPVKVLDFGLAKALEGDAGTTDISSSPTISRMATEAGMILGTAAYMSPEQAKGKSVDRRADIWAFGCVLYEMLTRKMAFPGETVTDTLAAIIKSEPDWSQLPAATPSRIRELLQRCLKKDIKQRQQSVGDARIIIDEILSDATQPESAAAGPKPPLQGWQRAWPWSIAVVLAAIAALFAAGYAARSPQPKPAIVSFIPAPSGTTFRSYGFGAGPVVVSPDGKQLAFSATDQDGVTKIWIRLLSSASVVAVKGTEDAANLFWSPDSQFLGFFANGKLKVVGLADGNVQVLTDADPGRKSAWGPDGTILFSRPERNSLYRISASGGSVVPATQLGKEESYHNLPAFLPDGKHFLYTSNNASGIANVSCRAEMASLDAMESKVVLKDACGASYAAGYLVFERNGEIFAQRFDPDANRLSGQATRLAEAASFSLAGDSVLAYQGVTETSHLEWFDRNGNPLGTTGAVAEYMSPKISPDRKQILAGIVDPQSGTEDLWSLPISSGESTRLTFEPGGKVWSAWSPDGKYIAYANRAAIFRKPADGSGEAETLLTLPSDEQRAAMVDWSPDGRYLAYDVWSVKNGIEEAWTLPLFGDKKPFQPAHISASQYDGVFSPDGHWFGYFSYESGRPEVYVVPFPGPGGKYQISHSGGWLARWATGGKLFYSTMGNRLMEADLALGPNALQVKAVHPLFEMNPPSMEMPLFDVMPDGTKFVVVTSDHPESSLITLLTNWTSLLKKQ